MGVFSKPKTMSVAPASAEEQNANEEQKSAAAKKERLLETSGGAKGQMLNSQQGRSLRRIFGN